MKKMIASFLVGALLTAQLHAQGLSNLQVGDRVRVTSSNVKKMTGQVDFLTSSEIGAFSDKKKSVVVIPRNSIRRVEMSQGRSRAESVKSGAKWGAEIGAVSGAVSVGAQHNMVGPSGSSVGSAALIGAVSSATFFGFIGAIIGAFHTKEKWKRVL